MTSYLQQYVARAVSSSLDAYFEGVSKEAVGVALWDGNLALEKLVLRRSVLEDLKLPLVVRSVTVKKLTATVPWGSFGMRPVVVTLEGVHVEAEPHGGWDWTPEEVEEYNLAAKVREVMRRVVQLEEASSAANSWLSGMAARFLENIQVRVTDLHLRYLDPTSNPERPFCVGVILEGLSYGASESAILAAKQEDAYSGGTSRFSLLRLANLCVYWDHPTRGAPSPALNARSRHQFLLHPTSGSLRIQIRRNADAGEDSTRSIFVDLSLQRLAVTLTDRQVEDLACFLRSHDQLQRSLFVALHRPRVPVSHAPRAWWRYAFECIRPALSAARPPPHSFASAGLALSRRKEYQAVYHRHLEHLEGTAPSEAPEAASEAEKEATSRRLRELDAELPSDVLVAFRRLVRLERATLRDKSMAAHKMAEAAETSASTWTSWLGLGQPPPSTSAESASGSPGSSGGFGLSAVDTAAPAAASALTSAERRTLLAQLFGREARPPAAERRPSEVAASLILFSIHATLNEGFLSFEVKSKELMHVIFDGLHRFHLRQGSWEHHFVLGGFQVIDMTTKASCLPSLVLPKPQQNSPVAKIGDFMVPKSFEVKVNFNPLRLRGSQDMAVDVQVFPFELVYSAPFLVTIGDFASNARVARVSAGVEASLAAFQEQQTHAIVQTLETRARLRVSAQIEASKLLIPVDVQDRRRDVVVVHLGRTTVLTDPNPDGPRPRALGKDVIRRCTLDAHEEGEAAFGETWLAEINDVSVVHFENLEAYRAVERRGGAASPPRGPAILDSFSLGFTVMVNVAAGADGHGHALMQCDLPDMTAHVSHAAFKAITSIDFGGGEAAGGSKGRPAASGRPAAASRDGAPTEIGLTLDLDRTATQSNAAGDRETMTRRWFYEAQVHIGTFHLSLGRKMAPGAATDAATGEADEAGEAGLPVLVALDLEGLDFECESLVGGRGKRRSGDAAAAPQVNPTVVRFFLTSITVWDRYHRVIAPEATSVDDGYSALLRCTGKEDDSGPRKFVAIERFREDALLTRVSLRAGITRVQWNPETLQQVMRVFQDGGRSSGVEAEVLVAAADMTLRGDSFAAAYATPSAAVNGVAPPERTDLEAELQEILVVFNKEHIGKPVLSAAVTGFRCHLRVDPHSAALSGELANLCVRDLYTPETRYSELIGLMPGVDESLVKFWFSQDTSAVATAPAWELSMHFSPMRFVFIYQLTLEMMDYLGVALAAALAPPADETAAPNESPGATTAQNASAASIASGGENRGSAFLPAQATVVSSIEAPRAEPPRAARIRIVMELKNPTLVLPVSQHSAQHFELNLGSVHVENIYRLEAMHAFDGPPTAGATPPSVTVLANVFQVTAPNLMLSSSTGAVFTAPGTSLHLDAFWCAEEAPERWPCPSFVCRGRLSPLTLSFDEPDYIIFVHLLFDNLAGLERHCMFHDPVLPSYAALDAWQPLRYRYAEAAANSAFLIELSTPELRLNLLDRGGASAPLLASASGTQTVWRLHRLHPAADYLMDLEILNIDLDGFSQGLGAAGQGASTAWPLFRSEGAQDTVPELQIRAAWPDVGVATYTVVLRHLWLWVRLPLWQMLYGILLDYPYDCTVPAKFLPPGASEFSPWRLVVEFDQPHLVFMTGEQATAGFVLQADTSLVLDAYDLDIRVSNGHLNRIVPPEDGGRTSRGLATGPSVLRPTTCRIEMRYAMPTRENPHPSRTVTDPARGGRVVVAPGQAYTLVDVGPLVMTLSYSDLRVLDLVVLKLQGSDGPSETPPEAPTAPPPLACEVLDPKSCADEAWNRNAAAFPISSTALAFRALDLTLVDDTGLRFVKDEALLRVEAERVMARSESFEDFEADEGRVPPARMTLHVGAVHLVDLLVSSSGDCRDFLVLTAEAASSGGSATPTEAGSLGPELDEDADADADAAWERPRALELVRVAGAGVSDVGLTVRTLAINWNPNTVIALKEVGMRYVQDRPRPPSHAHLAAAELTPAGVGDALDADPSSAARPPGPPMSATVEIKSLIVVLNKEAQNRRLLQAEVRNLAVRGGASLQRRGASAAGPWLRGSMTQMRLGSLRVRDLCSTMSLYPFVVSGRGPAGGGLVRAHFEEWQEGTIEDTGAPAQPTVVLQACVAPLRLVYYQEFTMEVLDYLLAQQIILGFDATPTDDADGADLTLPVEPQAPAPSLNPKMHLRVEVASPEMVLPPSAAEDCYLFVRLGDFFAFKASVAGLEAAFPPIFAPGGTAPDMLPGGMVSVQLKGSAIRCFFSRRDQGILDADERSIMALDGHVAFEISHPRRGEEGVPLSEELTWQVRGALPSITVSLRKKDLALVSDILSRNVLSGTIHGMELMILRSLNASLGTGAPGSRAPHGHTRLSSSPRLRSRANVVDFSYGKRDAAPPRRRKSRLREEAAHRRRVAAVRCEIGLPRVEVILLQGDDEDAAGLEAFATLRLEDISFSQEGTPEGTTRTTSAIHSVAAWDSRRSVSRPFRDLLSRIPPEEHTSTEEPDLATLEPQVSYTVQTRLVGNADSALVLQDVRVVLLFELLAMVQRFISAGQRDHVAAPPPAEVGDSNDDDPLLGSLGLEFESFQRALGAPASGTATAPRPGSWEDKVAIPELASALVRDSRVKVLFHRVEVLLLERPLRRVTKAICVRSLVHLGVNVSSSLEGFRTRRESGEHDDDLQRDHDLPTISREADMMLTGFQIDMIPELRAVSTDVPEPGLRLARGRSPEISLLCPVEVTWKVTAKATPGESPRVVGRLHLGPVRLEISYKDVRIVTAVVRNVYEYVLEHFATESTDDSSMAEMGTRYSPELTPSRTSLDSSGAAGERRAYDIGFFDATIGITFAKHGNLLVVDSFNETVLRRSGRFEDGAALPLQVGDVLVSIQGDSILRVSYDTSISLIRSLPRPLALSFQRDPERVRNSRWAAARPSSGLGAVVRLQAPSRLFERCLGISEGGRGLRVRCPYLVNTLFLERRRGAHRVGEGTKLVWVNDENVEMHAADEVRSLLRDTSYPAILRFRDETNDERKLRLHAQLESLALTFLDDSEGRQMPLFRANLSVSVTLDRDHDLDPKFLCSLEKDAGIPGPKPGFSQSNGEVQLVVSYYNPNIGLWEPLLESLDLYVATENRSDVHPALFPAGGASQAHDPGSKGSSHWAVSVTSLGPLNLNITDAWLLQAAQILRRYHRTAYKRSARAAREAGGVEDDIEGTAAVPTTSPTFSPLFLHNLSGVAVAVFLHGHDGTAADADNPPLLRLEAEGSEPGDPPSRTPLPLAMLAKGPGMGLRRDFDSLPTLDIEPEGFRRIERLGLGMKGRFRYECHTDGSHPSTVLLWDVNVTDGRRVATLRAGLGFKNCMDVPLEIAAQAPGKPPEVCSRVMSGDVVFVPLRLTHAENFCVRPATAVGADPYEWSWPVFDVAMAAEAEAAAAFRPRAGAVWTLRRFVACGAAGQGDSAFLFLDHADPDAEGDLHLNPHDLVVNIFASLVVRNDLLEEATVGVWSAAKAGSLVDGVLAESTLGLGAVAQIPTANAALDELRLRVRVRGMDVSAWVPLNTPAGQPSQTASCASQVQRVIVRDNQGHGFAFLMSWEILCDGGDGAGVEGTGGDLRSRFLRRRRPRAQRGEAVGGASAVMVRRVRVVLRPELILEDHTGLGLLFGLDSYEVAPAGLGRFRSPRSGQTSSVRRRRRQRLRTRGVRLSPWQGARVEEEIFELQFSAATPDGDDAWDHWFTMEHGEPRPTPAELPLPSDDWEWEEDEWQIDAVGLATSDGWESRRVRKLEAAEDAGDNDVAQRYRNVDPTLWFGRRARPEVRSFHPRHNLRRRRYFRHRRRCAGDESLGRITRVMASGPTRDDVFAVMTEAADRSRSRRTAAEELSDAMDLTRMTVDVQAEDDQDPLVATVGFRVRLPGGGYSESINARANGAEGAVQVPNATGEGDHASFQLAYEVCAAGASTVTRLRHRFVLANRTREVLIYRAAGQFLGEGMRLAPGDQVPVHTARLRLSFATVDGRSDAAWLWSGAVDLSDLWTFPLRICRREDPGEGSKPWRVVRVASRLNPSANDGALDGAILVSVREEGGADGGWVLPDDVSVISSTSGAPSARDTMSTAAAAAKSTSADAIYVLANDTDMPIYYGQVDVAKQQCLPPRSRVAFGWDEPLLADAAGTRLASDDGAGEAKGAAAPEPISPGGTHAAAAGLLVRCSLAPLSGLAPDASQVVALAPAPPPRPDLRGSHGLGGSSRRLGERVRSMTGRRGRSDAPEGPGSPRKARRFERAINPERIGKITKLPIPPAERGDRSRGRSRSPGGQQGVLILAAQASLAAIEGDPRTEPDAIALVSPRDSGGTVLATVAVQGSAKVLSFRFRPRRRLRPQLGRDRSESPSRRTSLVSDLTEDVPAATRPEGALTLSVPELHVSVIDQTPRELTLVTMTRVRCEALLHAAECRLSLKAGDIQTDNFLPYAGYPVVLSQKKRGREARDRAAPQRALNLAVWAIRPTGTSYTHVRQFSLALGEFDLRLDLDFITVLSAFLVRQGGVWADAFPEASRDADLKASALKYFELLQIDRVRFNASYKNSSGSKESRSAASNLLPKGSGAVSSTLLDMVGRMEGARIRLKSFVVKDYFGDTDGLVAQLSRHYTRELRRHVLEMIGALHLLGNPVGLVRSFRDGAKDFVAEPMHGLLDSIEQARPTALVTGFKRGTTSLLRNSVGGVVNSASLLTDMVSSQVSDLTMDNDDRQRQQSRREETSRQDATLMTGLGAGTRSLARSLFEGVSGVVTKPIDGAKRGGAAGLVRGLGAGVVGLVAKPVVGISDAATDVLRGVKGSVDTLHGDSPLKHVRPVRAIFGPAGQLRPYSLADAEANQLLHQFLGSTPNAPVSRGLEYNGYLETGRCIVLLATAAMLGVDMDGQETFRIGLQHVFVLEDTADFRGSQGVFAATGGVGVVVHVGGDPGSLRNDAPLRHFIPCGDAEQARQVCGKLTLVLEDFRAAQHNVLVAGM